MANLGLFLTLILKPNKFPLVSRLYQVVFSKVFLSQCKQLTGNVNTNEHFDSVANRSSLHCLLVVWLSVLVLRREEERA